MHTLRAHSRWVERLLKAGKLQLPGFRIPLRCQVLLRALSMSATQRIASALNQWERDGRDMMGGADGDALDCLLGDYFDFREEGSEIPGCK